MERLTTKGYFNNGYRTWDGIQIGGQIYDPDTDFTQVCTEACQDTSYCVGCPFGSMICSLGLNNPAPRDKGKEKFYVRFMGKKRN
uniref:Uncharacterized protein n=1 Tax=viral metagenome TaxID=1070528 RepID=A0A6M3M7C7_9ZZZZ